MNEFSLTLTQLLGSDSYNIILILKNNSTEEKTFRISKDVMLIIQPSSVIKFVIKDWVSAHAILALNRNHAGQIFEEQHKINQKGG